MNFSYREITGVQDMSARAACHDEQGLALKAFCRKKILALFLQGCIRITSLAAARKSTYLTELGIRAACLTCCGAC